MSIFSEINWNAVLAAIPALATFLTLMSRDRILEARVKRHAELLHDAPDGEGKALLALILQAELHELGRRSAARLYRKANWATVWGICIILLVATPLIWGVLSLASSVESVWMVWILRVLALALALVAIVTVIAGGTQIWKEEPEAPAAEGQNTPTQGV